MSFAESKRGVSDLVDSTYEAVLSDLDPRRFPRNALPCRSAGGSGAASGEYSPGGSLEFDLPRSEESKRYVTRVADHWREQGYEHVDVDPNGETVFAQTDGYRMSFNVTPDIGRGLLGASGPCEEPESEAQREAPIEFRSLGEGGS